MGWGSPPMRCIPTHPRRLYLQARGTHCVFTAKGNQLALHRQLAAPAVESGDDQAPGTGTAPGEDHHPHDQGGDDRGRHRLPVLRPSRPLLPSGPPGPGQKVADRDRLRGDLRVRPPVTGPNCQGSGYAGTGASRTACTTSTTPHSRQDASQVRTGAAPRVMASLRNLAFEPSPARRGHQHRPRPPPAPLETPAAPLNSSVSPHDPRLCLSPGPCAAALALTTLNPEPGQRENLTGRSCDRLSRPGRSRRPRDEMYPSHHGTPPCSPRNVRGISKFRPMEDSRPAYKLFSLSSGGCRHRLILFEWVIGKNPSIRVSKALRESLCALLEHFTVKRSGKDETPPENRR